MSPLDEFHIKAYIILVCLFIGWLYSIYSYLTRRQ